MLSKKKSDTKTTILWFMGKTFKGEKATERQHQWTVGSLRLLMDVWFG